MHFVRCPSMEGRDEDGPIVPAAATSSHATMPQGSARMTLTVGAHDDARTWSAFEAAQAELATHIRAHPFVGRCSDGTVPFDELRNFLVQHGRYSSYFTRYLCALISQLENGSDVLRLAENLVEELGNCGDDRVPHSQIYREMLEALHIEPEADPTFPETQNLIDTMFMLCRQPRGLAGLGALYLGAESIVPELYGAILKGLRSHAVPEGQLRFFTMHVACDEEHAKTIRAIIARMVLRSPSNQLTIVSAGEVAIGARLRFFDGLSEREP
jgi:pyrroloquinoline-quinone synthase